MLPYGQEIIMKLWNPITEKALKSILQKILHFSLKPGSTTSEASKFFKDLLKADVMMNNKSESDVKVPI